MRSRFSPLFGLPAFIVVAFLAAACANMGRPEGGPRDEEPPHFIRSTPAPGATNVSTKHLTAIFNENIQLEDAFSKVVVSPAQKQPPAVSANGRRLIVVFRDTLLPNTTYTIDFADAIKDLNEGNILDGFALDFSTGDSIDSLRISGMVLQAENLEPAQGMLVGVYSNLEDSAIRTLPFERIARTNQLGHFTIRNLKPGDYRIFAVNDLNRDYHWDRSEDVAFYDITVSPRAEHFELNDTLRASDGSDSIVARQGLRFLPNDILLCWFNETYKPQYLLDYKREDRNRITVKFAAPADSLPRISIVEGGPEGLDISKWARLNASSRLDSLEYWIEPEYLEKADSLKLSVGYMRTDSTDALTWTTDTLRFYYRNPNRGKKKKEKQESPSVNDSISTDNVATIKPTDFLSLNIGSSSQELNRPLLLTANEPLDSIDLASLHLEIQKDTLWLPVAETILLPDSTDLLRVRRLDIKWEPGGRYRLTLDSLAAHGMYGHWNRPFKHEFSVKNLEDYSTLTFNISGLDSIPAIIQLLNTSDTPAYTAWIAPGENTAVFRFVNPGTYYARLYLDRNSNRRWDTGNIAAGLQPEEAFYFPKKLQLKKNWEISQDWNIYESAVDLQKPYAIKKNKPKLKRGEEAPRDPDEEEEYDEFGSDRGFGRDDYRGSGNRGGRFGGGLRPNRGVGNTIAR